jgi:hypothetical protein
MEICINENPDLMSKLWLLMICVLCLVGCKKDDASPESFLTAKIGGKNWIANVPNSENTNVAAVIAQQNIALSGVQETATEKTSLVIIFPENVSVGQEIEVNPLNRLIVAYALTDTDAYLVDPAQGVTGKLKVTNLDTENGVVEGTFSGEAVNNKNGDKVKITNGQFRSRLYTASVATPKPGKK